MRLPARKLDSARTRGALIVFCLALAVRLMFFLATSDRQWPHSVLYEGDAPVWARWAEALDHGESFEFDLPMRTPGVAFLLHWVDGGRDLASFALLKGLWCGLGAATVAALFALTHRALGARAAWLAALLACFSFGSYQLAGSLNSEAPYALLLVLLVGATAQQAAAPRPGLALALGVLHGAALLLRAEHGLLMALFLPWGLAVNRTRASLQAAGLTLLATLLVCAPWVLRSHAAVVNFNTSDPHPVNFTQAAPPWSPEAQAFLATLPAFAREGNFAYVQFLAQSSGKPRVEREDLERHFDLRFGYRPEPLAEWTLVSSKGAFDFALANHPASGGGFSRAALLDGFDATPEFAFGRPSHLRLYNRGFEVGWGFIRQDVPAWFRLVGRKFERFLDGASLGWTPWDLPHGGAHRRRSVDLSTPLEQSRAATILLGVLALAGLILVARTPVGALCALVLGHKLVITALFYGYARQAVSIQFVFALFMAAALDRLLERARVPRSAAAVGLGVLFTALLACDVIYVSGRRDFDIRPTAADLPIARTPHWGAGAFESVGEIEILPRGPAK